MSQLQNDEASTFWSRWRFNIRLCNPYYLTIPNARMAELRDQVREYQQLKRQEQAVAEEMRRGEIRNTDTRRRKEDIFATRAELELTRDIVNTAAHPVSGEIVPRIFRMNGFGLLAVPLILFQIMPSTAQSIPRTFLSLFAFQSLGAFMNHYNRSSSPKDKLAQLQPEHVAFSFNVPRIFPTANNKEDKQQGSDSESAEDDSNSTVVVVSKEIAWSYARAVTFGISVISTGHYITRRNPQLRLFIPCVAACSSSLFNLFQMRYTDIFHGIPVHDCNTDDAIGNSRRIGFLAWWQSAQIRLVGIPFALLVPQAVQYAILRSAAASGRPAISTRMQDVLRNVLAVIGFMVGLPMSMSLHTERITVPASEVTDISPLHFHAGAEGPEVPHLADLDELGDNDEGEGTGNRRVTTPLTHVAAHGVDDEEMKKRVAVLNERLRRANTVWYFRGR